MCGITGFCDFTKRTEKSTLITMTDILHHRGPDDSGYSYYKNESYTVGLGHRRLSIMDLSKHGHQPMKYEQYEIIYNGEVYNFREIREELETYGYLFESDSDTEVILKAYDKWGIESVNKFSGMFAISMYDKKNQKIILMRDRIGKKPLYYSYNNGYFLFASELKSLMLYPNFEKNINNDALNLFLFHGYITAPHTIFKKTYKLEPGKYLELDLKNKTLDIHTYWSIEEQFKRKEIFDYSEDIFIEKLDEVLTSAVQYRMISDVPIGSFLSGGYDSSLISAIMQKLSNKPIDTFTIGFNEKKFNEAHYAKEVADHLKTNHHELYLPIKDASELISEIPKYYDEPFADSSQIPTMLVSKLAKERVTVTLSGDGGDELFCGYHRYDTALGYQKYKAISKSYRAFDTLVNMDKITSRMNSKLTKLNYLNSDENIINFKYLSTKVYLEGLVKESTYTIDNRYFDILKLSNNIQEKYMLQDMVTYLPDDILTKVDRASMAYSLESRTPILDHKVIEYSMNVPHALKYKNGDKKYLLKALTHRYIPKKIMDRPKKGFGVPIYEWLHSDMNYLIEKYFNQEYIRTQNIFDHQKLQIILNKFKNRDELSNKFVWNIIVFQMWYEEYMV